MKRQHTVSAYWEVQSRPLAYDSEWYSWSHLRSPFQTVMGGLLWSAVLARVRLAAARNLWQKETPEFLQTILMTRCTNAAPGDEVEFDGHAFRYVLVQVRR